MFLKKKFVVCVVVILLLVITLVTVKSNRFKNVEPEVRELVYSSLDLQYNRFSCVNPKNIIYGDLLRKNERSFYYQYSRWPYIVIDMREFILDGKKCLNITLADRKGEYIEGIQLIRINGKYMIEDIWYDI